MNAATLGIASDFVKAGIARAGIPLTETLEAYLSITFARFIGARIAVDLLTVRVNRAMDANAPRDTIRDLADECLIACAFFEGRLRRNGTIRHYVDEQAWGFVHMRDVIASAAGRDAPEEAPILIDRARAGSQTARAELARQNVVVGPWGEKPGLLLR
jgi:hypothetical protein